MMLGVDKNYNLKAGDHINFGEGEYEDYTEFGDMEVLKDFNIQQEAGKYIKEHSTLSIYDFLSNLEEAGLVKKYEVKTFYIGSMSYDGNDFDWFENFSNEEVENNIDKWLNEEEDEE